MTSGPVPSPGSATTLSVLMAAAFLACRGPRVGPNCLIYLESLNFYRLIGIRTPVGSDPMLARFFIQYILAAVFQVGVDDGYATLYGTPGDEHAGGLMACNQKEV